MCPLDLVEGCGERMNSIRGSPSHEDIVGGRLRGASVREVGRGYGSDRRGGSHGRDVRLIECALVHTDVRSVHGYEGRRARWAKEDSGTGQVERAAVEIER